MHYAQSSPTSAQVQPSSTHCDVHDADDDVPVTSMQFSGHDFNTNRNSWMGSGGGAGCSQHQKQMPMAYIGVGQHSSYPTEEPVYEEIMSNRIFDSDVGGSAEIVDRSRHRRQRQYDARAEYNSKKRYDLLAFIPNSFFHFPQLSIETTVMPMNVMKLKSIDYV